MNKWRPYTFRKSVWKEVTPIIRRVPQYQSGVTFQLSEVDVAKLKPICLTIRLGRLGQVFKLVHSLIEEKIELFDPVRINIPAGGSAGKFIPPPIVETHGDLLVVINGLHRIYTARLLNIKSVKAICVSGDLPPCPADILTWDDVSISTQPHTPRGDKFRNFKPNLFREISKYVEDSSGFIEDEF